MLPEIFENRASGTISFQVRVQPRASKDEIAGVVEGALKVRLQAPAPKSAVRILTGDRSRMKRVQVYGVTKQQVLDLLLHAA